MFASLGLAPVKVWTRFSILAHQLRRRFSSDHSLLAEEPDWPSRLRDPKARWSFDPSGLALVDLDPCEP